MKKHLFYLSVSILLFGCINKKEVDLIIHNAHIFTINEIDEEYEAMVIDDGKIIDLGKENQILNKYTSQKKNRL